MLPPVLNIGIPAHDLRNIEAMLRIEDPFCSSVSIPGLYSVELYQSERVQHGTATRLLIDRNVFSRVVALTNGVVASAEHRLTAAIMAFVQCGGIELEPNLAARDWRTQI